MAASLMAFFGKLHISELVARSKSDVARRALLIGDEPYQKRQPLLRFGGQR